jgi:hypothetical protein
MAQDTGQANVQTIRMPYRSTDAGGYDKTFIATPSGELIKPIKQRSRSGNHGWDEWVLEPGRYAVVTVSRPNLNGKPKPYTVNLQCVEITNESRILNTKTIYVMDWSLEDVRNWATQICP